MFIFISFFQFKIVFTFCCRSYLCGGTNTTVSFKPRKLQEVIHRQVISYITHTTILLISNFSVFCCLIYWIYTPTFDVFEHWLCMNEKRYKGNETPPTWACWGCGGARASIYAIPPAQLVYLSAICSRYIRWFIIFLTRCNIWIFSAWYQRRQMKKIYSPLLEGLLALYLGFEWIQVISKFLF